MQRAFAILGVLCATGCRDHAATAPTVARTAPAALVPAPASPTDEVVARVNDQPVYASCVVAQAAHAHTDAKGGLEQCIEFELLAQAATAKGLAMDPTVVDGTRTALVSRLVEVGFEASHRTAADMQPQVDLVLSRDPRGNAPSIPIAEQRRSAYARVVLDPTAPPARVEQAHGLADAIYRRLANESGVLSATLADAAKAVVPGTGFEYQSYEVPAHPQAWFDATYGTTLWALTEVGRVAAPVRTSLGWDVILLDGISPAHELTREQRVAEVFPDVRRSLFKLWVDDITRALKVHIVQDDDTVTRALEAAST